MKLEALIKQKGTLSDEEIIQYSRKLDILINEYLENENHSHSK